MKAGDIVKITKCSNPDSVGFYGKLYTNLACFHANARILSIFDIAQIDKNKACIGIINEKQNKCFLWTKQSDFYVEITYLNKRI